MATAKGPSPTGIVVITVLVSVLITEMYRRLGGLRMRVSERGRYLHHYLNKRRTAAGISQEMKGLLGRDRVSWGVL